MRGRPKSFDRDEVLSQVTACFWDKGYDGSAVRDLEAATGLGRQSLYNEFGDKRQLYLASLKHYVATHQSDTLSGLYGDGSPLERVKAMLRASGEYAASSGCKGCLLVNAAAEESRDDAAVSALLREAMRGFDAALAEALHAAVQQGELPKDFPVESTARALGTFCQGLGLRGRLGVGREEIDAAVRGALALLEP